MTTRVHFDRQLNELRDDILLMGSRVEEELRLALDALYSLDLVKSKQVYEADAVVNKTRFEIEEKCFALIVTQQPAARDLRTVISAINMIVDLERMGDQAKGIAKVIPHLLKQPTLERPSEIKQMGALVGRMLNQVMLAYAQRNIELARLIAGQDDEVDRLYAQVFTFIMRKMAAAGSADEAEVLYELLRVARELERFGDLATNVAERSIYQVTGQYTEINVDQAMERE